MKKFILTVFLLTITRFYDIYTTYLYIPDLEGEMNPLASLFNLGWGPLLLVQVAALAFLTYCAYIYHFMEVKTPGIDNNCPLTSFISLFHFQSPHQFNKVFYKLPTNKPSLLFTIGGILPKALIIISLMVGTSTTMLINSKQYRTFYETFGFPVILGMIVAVISILTVRFYVWERKKRIES